MLSAGAQNRPNRVCDGSLDNPTIDQWFDTSCFVPPSDTTGTFGDAGRNILRGPGQFNIDASIIKRTKIGRFDTEIRIEAFNVLNHPQFANPESNRRLVTLSRERSPNAVESGVLALRHDRAAGADRREDAVLRNAGFRPSGFRLQTTADGGRLLNGSRPLFILMTSRMV